LRLFFAQVRRIFNRYYFLYNVAKAKKEALTDSVANPTEADELIDEAVALQPEAPAPASDTGDFLLKYRNVIGGALILGLLALIGWFYWNGLMDDKNKEGLEQMSQAVQFFENDSIDKALKGTSQYLGFVQLVEDYSGTKAGNLSKFYLGRCYMKKEKYTEALEAFESFDKSENMLAAMAYGGMGLAHEELKEFEKAASAYKKAAGTKENIQTTPYYLFQAARVYEYADDKAAALELYKRIEREYPQSEEARGIERFIAKLED